MKDQLYLQGLSLLHRFCVVNQIPSPTVTRLYKGDRLFELGTCAFYRPHTIRIMVEKCATIGQQGRQWSCPGHWVDRTPYGVLQHELGHHVDDHLTNHFQCRLFSVRMFTNERPLTGYLGTDTNSGTFNKEWFAEMFRLFVTNPDLLCYARPATFKRLLTFFTPVVTTNWRETLVGHNCPERTISVISKRILSPLA